jgi:hypothetical protein
MVQHDRGARKLPGNLGGLGEVPCVDDARLARVFVTGDAELVGAAMCSTC